MAPVSTYKPDFKVMILFNVK